MNQKHGSENPKKILVKCITPPSNFHQFLFFPSRISLNMWFAPIFLSTGGEHSVNVFHSIPPRRLSWQTLWQPIFWLRIFVSAINKIAIHLRILHSITSPLDGLLLIAAPPLRSTIVSPQLGSESDSHVTTAHQKERDGDRVNRAMRLNGLVPVCLAVGGSWHQQQQLTIDVTPSWPHCSFSV